MELLLTTLMMLTNSVSSYVCISIPLCLPAAHVGRARTARAHRPTSFVSAARWIFRKFQRPFPFTHTLPALPCPRGQPPRKVHAGCQHVRSNTTIPSNPVVRIPTSMPHLSASFRATMPTFLPADSSRHILPITRHRCKVWRGGLDVSTEIRLLTRHESASELHPYLNCNTNKLGYFHGTLHKILPQIWFLLYTGNCPAVSCGCVVNLPFYHFAFVYDIQHGCLHHLHAATNAAPRQQAS